MYALAARSAARQVSLKQARAFHASGVARSAGHDHYHHLPFAFPTNGPQRFSFGTKVAVYLGFGFAIPFAASIYQLKKSAGSD